MCSIPNSMVIQTEYSDQILTARGDKKTSMIRVNFNIQKIHRQVVPSRNYC